MFQRNLLLIYRNFRRFKTTFFINLIGLSTGLACAIMIFLWTKDEMEVDRFHLNDGSLYQIMVNEKSPDGLKTLDGTSGILGETLKNEIPEVEYTTVITPPSWFQKFTLADDKVAVNAHGFFAGEDFLNVFSYELIQGNRNQVLHDKNAIVLSAKTALDLFHTTENIIGKSIEWKWLDFKKTCVVSGVLKDVPGSSSYQFDFLLPFQAWNDIVPPNPDVFVSGPFYTFVVLRDHVSAADFTAKLTDFAKKKDPKSNSALFVRKFGDAYLHGTYENGVQAGGKIEYVKLFSLIGIFILVIACVNFMNLSTARASVRIKEVGVRKVAGASRLALVRQYLGESVLISFFSLIFSLTIVQLLLPQFNIITAKQLTLNVDVEVMVSLVVITFFTGLLAGSYPALYLSGFKPAAVLKGLVRSSSGEFWIRKGLVVFQFAVALIFIMAVFVLYEQTEFIQSRHLGFNKDNVVCFDAEGKAITNMEAFLNEIRSVPGVTNASTIMGNILVPSFRSTGGVQWDGKNQDDKIMYGRFTVNYDFIETLGMKMKEGQSFNRSIAREHAGIIFNETAIREMGIDDPVGKKITVQGEETQISGVVEDFHFQSLHETVKPMYFRLSPAETMTVLIKIEAGTEKETVQRLQKFYTDYNPGYTLEYRFLDQDYQALYVSEQRVATLSKYFAALAILISMLGLFGLAAFTTEKRIKEIGIRKMLGSSAVRIVWLLTFDFVKSVLMAIVIAGPLSYWIVSQWLDGFAYRIELQWWYFVLSAAAIVVIAWITVASHALRGASVNPSACLKNE